MPSAKSGGARLSLSLNLLTIISLLGYASCIASLVGLFLFRDNHLGDMDDYVCKGVYALVIAGVFWLFHVLANQFATKRGVIATCVMAAVGFIAYVASIIVPEELPIIRIVFSCFAAAGLTALAMFWFSDLCVNPRRRAHAYVAAAIGLGLLICVGECFFTQEVRTVSSAAIWCVSLAFAFARCRDHLKDTTDSARQDARKSDARSRIQKESVIMLAIINAQFGFLIGMAQADAGCNFPFVLLTGFATCAVVSMDAMGKRQRISEESVYPVTIPLTVAAFVGMYLFGSGVAHIIALCILAIIVSLYLVSGLVAINRHIILANLSPISTYGRARAIDYCMTALGVALGIAAGLAFSIGQIEGIQVTVGIAVVYAFVASFFHKARFPDSTLKSDGSVGFAPAQEKGQWKRRCREVSERFNLSDRQYEVLCLIGQGRNAEYVANSLTISVSTVQTHIRNIYQKLGVHSRQELLDLIENTKLYGED